MKLIYYHTSYESEYYCKYWWETEWSITIPGDASINKEFWSSLCIVVGSKPNKAPAGARFPSGVRPKLLSISVKHKFFKKIPIP